MIISELQEFPNTSELSEITAIVYPAVLGVQYTPESGQELNLADTIAPYSNYVGYFLGKVAGFGSIDFRHLQEGVASLENICIRPDLRGQGLGKILISKLEEEAIKREAQLLVLDSLDNTIGFYAGLGYSRISQNSSRLGKSLLL